MKRSAEMPGDTRWRSLLVSMTLGLLGVGAAFVAMRAWMPEVIQTKDERFYWPAAQALASSWWPSADELRASMVPTTPLGMMIWAWGERLTHGGVVFGRVLSALATLGTVALIATFRARRGTGGDQATGDSNANGARSRRPLSVLGLCLCPYFAGFGVLLYTDAFAVFFVTLGMWLHFRARWIAGGVAFAAAVATRQYAVAFPAALAAWELWRAVGVRAGSSGEGRAAWRHLAWAVPLAAAATLGGWYVLYGGLAPAGAIQAFEIGTARGATWIPQNGLYALACVGAYFVMIEAILFRRVTWIRGIPRLWMVATVGVLGAMYAMHPPLRNSHADVETMGCLDVGLRRVFPDWARVVVFCALSVAAVLRLWRCWPAALMLLAHGVVLAKAHVAWDKYSLPMLAILWMLAADDGLDGACTERSRPGA